MDKNSTRAGDWMQTAGGRQFWPLDPRAEDVDIGDIAHALANVCRFGGHCRTFYSVAEHSVRVSFVAERLARVSQIADREIRLYALAGLLHDASEAYLGDMIQPLKHQPQMAAYKVAEAHVEWAIAEKFGIFVVMPACVRAADEILLATEARDVMGGRCAGKWTLHAEPDDSIIDPWTPTDARAKFLRRFADLEGVAA